MGDIDAFLKALRRVVQRAGSQKAAATELGIALGYLNDVLHGRRAPGPKLLEAMGYTRAWMFERKETQEQR